MVFGGFYMLAKKVAIGFMVAFSALTASHCLADDSGLSNWPSVDQLSPKELEPFWNAQHKKILHSIAGDDLQAYFGIVPSLTVLDTPKLDAFVTEKGELYFSSGLLRLIESESELAFIISHEIGHVLLGHHRSALTRLHLASPGAKEGSYLHQEIGADALASDLLSEAGYDTASGVHFMERISKIEASLRKDGLLQAKSDQIHQRLSFLKKHLQNTEAQNQP